MVNMIEPVDPNERALAIRICRANASLDQYTGQPIEDRDAGRKQWHDINEPLPYSKWIWMWNHCRSEWDPSYSPPSQNGEKQS